MRIVILVVLASLGGLAYCSSCGITKEQLKKLNDDMEYISDLAENLRSTYGDIRREKRDAKGQESEYNDNADNERRQKRQQQRKATAVEPLSTEKRLVAVEDATQNLLFQWTRYQEKEEGVQVALQQYEEMVRKFVEARMDSFQATIVQAFMTSAADVEQKIAALVEKTNANEREIEKLKQEQYTIQQNCSQQSLEPVSCANQDLLETIENRIVVATNRYDDRLESARNAFKTEITSVATVQSLLQQRIATVSKNVTELYELVLISSEKDFEISNVLNKLNREIGVVATKTMAHVFSALNGFDKDHKTKLHSMNRTLVEIKEDISLNNEILYRGLAATNVTVNSIKAYLTESDLQGSQTQQVDTTLLQDIIDRLEEQQQLSEVTNQNSVEYEDNRYEAVSELMLKQSEEIQELGFALQQVISETDVLHNKFIELKRYILEMQKKNEQLEPLHQLLELKYLPKELEARSLTTTNLTARSQRCHAIGHLQTIPGTDVWCSNNCAMGYCPTELCDCSISTARKAERIICRATAAFGMIRNANEWCETNCAAGHCPPRQCICTPQQSRQITPQKVCHAVAPFSLIPNADQWCSENCASGHCPPTSCVCEQ